MKKRPLVVPVLAREDPGRDEPTEPDIAEDGRRGESEDDVVLRESPPGSLGSTGGWTENKV